MTIRAKKGGQIGSDGKFYKGGQFFPQGVVPTDKKNTKVKIKNKKQFKNFYFCKLNMEKTIYETFTDFDKWFDRVYWKSSWLEILQYVNGEWREYPGEWDLPHYDAEYIEGEKIMKEIQQEIVEEIKCLKSKDIDFLLCSYGYERLSGRPYMTKAWCD